MDTASNPNNSRSLQWQRSLKAIECERQQLQRALVELQNERHVAYQEGLAHLGRVKARRLAHAETQYRLLEQSTLVVFHYERDEAESEYSLNHEKWQSDLLEEVQSELRRLRHLLDGSKPTKKAKQKSSKKSTRQTRSTRGKIVADHLSSSHPHGVNNGAAGSSSYRHGSMDDSNHGGGHHHSTSLPYYRPSSANSISKLRKKNGAMFPSVRVHLLRSEVDKDLTKLMKSFKSVAAVAANVTSTVSNPMISSARMFRNRLFYNDLIVEEGDEVLVVRNSASSSISPLSLSGMVTAFSATEVFLLQADGTAASVEIMDLRSGDASLSILTDSSDEEEDELEQY